jgi:uncharacterized LabA/DUF88 family protein
MKTRIYIDGNNLYRAAKELGFDIDYKKFRGWLRQKYNPEKVFLFIGLIPENTNFYNYLQNCGYILVFKQTISVEGKVKGNCNAELVLKVVSDFYQNEFEKCILITGDGDFGCAVQFLKENKKEVLIISPDENKCSILLRNKNVEMLFLNEHYHKLKRKTPDVDVST